VVTVDLETQTSPTITIAVIGEDQHGGFTSIGFDPPGEADHFRLYIINSSRSSLILISRQTSNTVKNALQHTRSRSCISSLHFSQNH
jgi:hypothetical protein